MRSSLWTVLGAVAVLLGLASSGAGAGVSGGTYSPRDIEALAIDPASPSTIYVATTAHRVFKSTDAGASWSAASVGLTCQNVHALAIDPVKPSTVYAGTNEGVFKSTDAGATWVITSAGLPLSRCIYDVAIDPGRPNTLFAGGSGSPGGFIFKSTDAGRTWVPSSEGLPTSGVHVLALAFDAAPPHTIYAGTNDGVYRSTDAGATWVAASVGMRDRSLIPAMAIDTGNPSTLYAARYGGVYRSTDSATTWTDGGTGEGISEGTLVRALAINSSTATLYIGVGGGAGVFRKDTKAGTAKGVSGMGALPNRDVQALAIDPKNPATLYAGASSYDVFKSIDGGRSWSLARKGLPEVTPDRPGTK